MIQKKGHMTTVKYHLFGLITAVGMVSALWCQSFVSLADSTGKVTVESAKIREKADTGSGAVGSVSYGNTVTITDEVQDSSGTLWYQVNYGNTTGYIRSDLVDKQGDSDSSSDTDQSSSGVPGASVDPGTYIDPQYATVSAGTINVRTAPSANDGVVDKLTRDAQVIVSGQSDGSDGKLWYYVTFTGTNGAERSGYIRSDLLSLGDMVPVPEEEVSEPQEPVSEPEESVSDLEYELTHELSVDGSGDLEWYLYDYTTEDSPYNRYRLEDLLAATKVRSENDAKDAKTLVRQRIAIVVLIVLVVALIVLAVIMALKLRDVYYEDYEDGEEEEEGEVSARRLRRAEETEETSTQRRRRERETEEISTQRGRRTEKEGTAQRRRRTQESGDSSERRRRRTEEDDVSVRRRRRAEEEENEADISSVAAAPKRKSKNFLLDDDEFEFEFLNMDDKNL